MIFKLFILLSMVYLSYAEDVKSRINRGLEKLYHVENGVAKPNVCLICDRFTGPDWSLMGIKELQTNRSIFR